MLPVELIKSFNDREVVIFIGAGISSGAGLPGWVALLQPLAENIGISWPIDELAVTSDWLLSVAQYYENQRGRNALILHLKDTLGLNYVQPTLVHDLITCLPVKLILTTNYDDLMEHSMMEHGHRINVVINESDLAFWREEQTQLVKLCGDIHQPESIIITKHDFSTYFAVKPRLSERLRSILETETPLFLGYSLQDPFLEQIWDQIGVSFGSLRRPGYAIMFDVDPFKIDDLRRRGIYVINIQSQGRNKSDIVWNLLSPLSIKSAS